MKENPANYKSYNCKNNKGHFYKNKFNKKGNFNTFRWKTGVEYCVIVNVGESGQ